MILCLVTLKVLYGIIVNQTINPYYTFVKIRSKRFLNNKIINVILWKRKQEIGLHCSWFVGSMLTGNSLVSILQLISSHKEESSMSEKQNQICSLGNYQLGWLTMGEFEFYLKKFIILVFESASISVTLSSACCMWCNHLSAAWWVTGNGRWRPISAGWPTESIFDDLLTWYTI